jgi:hypothetical protein
MLFYFVFLCFTLGHEMTTRHVYVGNKMSLIRQDRLDHVFACLQILILQYI